MIRKTKRKILREFEPSLKPLMHSERRWSRRHDFQAHSPAQTDKVLVRMSTKFSSYAAGATSHPQTELCTTKTKHLSAKADLGVKKSLHQVTYMLHTTLLLAGISCDTWVFFAKRLNFKPILEIHQICKQVAESTGSRLQLSNPMSQTSFQPCFGWRVLPHSFNQFHPCSRQVPNIFRIHGSMTLNGGQFQMPNFRQVTGSKWESIAANCWKTSPLCVQFLENLWALDPLRCGQCVWSLLGAL